MDAVAWPRAAKSSEPAKSCSLRWTPDGVKDGFDCALTMAVSARHAHSRDRERGAGKPEHLSASYRRLPDAALAASIFHYGTLHCESTQKSLDKRGIPSGWRHDRTLHRLYQVSSSRAARKRSKATARRSCGKFAGFPEIR